MMFGSCRAIWVRASLVGVSVRSVVVQKKTDSMTEQEQLVCKMCNVKYDESSGRVHGGCHTCASADRALRRNLGDRSEVQEFSKAEAMEFFRKVKEAKEESPGKRLQWQTLLLKLNLCFLRTKMQTACTNGNAQHVDDAIFCQQVNSSTGNCATICS